VLGFCPCHSSERAAHGGCLLLQIDNPFWRFSLAVYAAPGVAAECLALQRALNIDVNVLLFCAWLGAQRTLLTAEDIDGSEAIVRPWHESVVRALRGARDAMKPMPEMAEDEVKALRKQILAVELRSEQIEQALLFQASTRRTLTATMDSAEEAVRTNLRTFLLSKTENRVEAAMDLSVDALIRAAVTCRS
jgi:uncharacterized protein (TIGR02444 family)